MRKIYYHSRRFVSPSQVGKLQWQFKIDSLTAMDQTGIQAAVNKFDATFKQGHNLWIMNASWLTTPANYLQRFLILGRVSDRAILRHSSQMANQFNYHVQKTYTTIAEQEKKKSRENLDLKVSFAIRTVRESVEKIAVSELDPAYPTIVDTTTKLGNELENHIKSTLHRDPHPEFIESIAIKFHTTVKSIKTLGENARFLNKDGDNGWNLNWYFTEVALKPYVITLDMTSSMLLRETLQDIKESKYNTSEAIKKTVHELKRSYYTFQDDNNIQPVTKGEKCARLLYETKEFELQANFDKAASTYKKAMETGMLFKSPYQRYISLQLKAARDANRREIERPKNLEHKNKLLHEIGLFKATQTNSKTHETESTQHIPSHHAPSKGKTHTD